MKKFFQSLFSKDSDLNHIETAGGKLSLMGLFWPLLIETVLRNLMNTVNTVILSGYSDQAATAVGIAAQVLTLLTMSYIVISNGASVIISQHLGAGNRKRAVDIGTVSVVLVLVWAVIASIIFVVFAEGMLGLMQTAPEFIPEAKTYLQIASAFSIFESVTTILSAIARSYGNTKPSLITMIVMNALNAIGGYIVIYRPFEIPLYGVEGIAIVREISAFVAMVVMIFLIMRSNLEFNRKSIFHGAWANIKSILGIGLPNGVSFISYNFSQIVSTTIISMIGMTATTAKTYVTTVVFYVALAGMAIGQANGVMIGWLAGARQFDRAYRMLNRNLLITICLNMFFALTVILFRYQLIGMLTTDADVIALAMPIFFIDFIVEIGRGMNNVCGNSLVATGDMKYYVTISVISCWVCSILFSYILGVVLGWGLAGCWISFAIDELFRGIRCYSRWRSKKWQTKIKIEAEEA